MARIEVHAIDSNVPIPEDKRIPLSVLGVGDSVLFPLSKRNSVQARISVIKRNEGKEFTIKKINDKEARVWRIS